MQERALVGEEGLGLGAAERCHGFWFSEEEPEVERESRNKSEGVESTRQRLTKPSFLLVWKKRKELFFFSFLLIRSPSRDACRMNAEENRKGK